MTDIIYCSHGKKPITKEHKLSRLYNLAYTVHELDGDFALYMQFVETDETLSDVSAVDIVNMWGRARRSISVDKEINLIYGREL